MAWSDYRIILLDKNGNRLRILRENVDSVTWEYKRVGGCGDMQLIIRDKFDDYGTIAVDYEIQLWIKTYDDSDYKLIYSGYIYDKIPSLEDGELITLRCSGYVGQLDRVVVRKDYDMPYNNATISGGPEPRLTRVDNPPMVNDIIQNYVEPVTRIIFDTDLIETAMDISDPDTAYAPDEFNTGDSAEKMIKELAILAGNWEWGVNAEKKFYFCNKSNDRGYNFIVGSDVKSFRPQESYAKIKNRVILKMKGKTILVLEREDDLGLDQSQLDNSGGWQEFGTNACQKLKLKFLPDRISFSKIEFQAQTQGFINKIIDGDMEEYTTAGWDKHGGSTIIAKNTDTSLDYQSMKINTLFPGMAQTKVSDFIGALQGWEGFGVSQTVNLTDEHYVLTYSYYLTKGDMFVQIWDKTNEDELGKFSYIMESEVHTTKKQWVTDYISFTVGGLYNRDHEGPIDVEIRFYSAKKGISIFYIDNVSLVAADDAVNVSVREEDSDTELAHYTVAREDWTGTVSVWMMHYPMDRSKVHEVILERTRAIAGYGFNDTNYYEVKKGS